MKIVTFACDICEAPLEDVKDIHTYPSSFRFYPDDPMIFCYACSKLVKDDIYALKEERIGTIVMK